MSKTEVKPKVKAAPRQKKSPARDDKFVDLVAKGKAPSDAYVEAGFTKTKNVSVNANKKLKQPKMVVLLEKRKAEFRQLANIEARDIIGAQAEIAFASIEDAVTDGGVLDFAKAKRNGSAKLIKRITRSPNKYGETVAVEFYSRTDALGQLADILGIKQQPKANAADLDNLAKAVASRFIAKLNLSETEAWAMVAKIYPNAVEASSAVH